MNWPAAGGELQVMLDRGESLKFPPLPKGKP